MEETLPQETGFAVQQEWMDVGSGAIMRFELPRSFFSTLVSTSLISASVGLFAACGGSSDGGDDDPAGPDAGSNPIAAAAYAPPAPGSGAAWGAVPFPSDLYLDADGRLTLQSLPAGVNADPNMVEYMKDTLHRYDGAGVWSGAFVPVDGELDPDTLAGNVVLVELDNDLAEVPTDLRWRSDLGGIVAVPKVGHVLHQRTRYAVYVTSGVLATDGSSLAPAPAFVEAMDASATPTDPGVAAAQDSLRPLVEALDASTAASLVSASVFTTADVTSEMRAMRDVVAGIAPTVTIDDVWGPDPVELNQLFGPAPPDALPGFLHGQTRNHPHGNIAVVIHGTIALPSFLASEPNVAGFVEVDGDGTPVVKGTHGVAFTLTLPNGVASYADTPVVVYNHGMNRTRVDMLAQANSAAGSGMAMLAIDIAYHGSRSLTTSDAKNDLTGEVEPDGFGDLEGLLPAANFFHLLESGGIPAYHPGAMLDNLRQGAADLCSLASFVRIGDVGPINAALGAAALPADLSFRPEMGMLSESFGAMIASVAASVEPSYDVVFVSSVAAGFPYPSMLHSANFSGTFANVVLAPFDIASRVTLGDDLTGARFDPMVWMWNIALERGEPTAYGPYVLGGAARGDEGPNFVLTESYRDEWVPNEATEGLAGAMGLPLLTMDQPAPDNPRLRFAELADVSGPVSGNVAGGARSAVHTLWNPGAHALIRKITDQREYGDLPPFDAVDPPVPYDSPVVQVHEMWTEMFASFFAGNAAATIADPYAD